MAKMPEIYVAVTVEVKKRAKAVGPWESGRICSKCSRIQFPNPFGRVWTPAVCPECGTTEPGWKARAVRKVRVKTGFWPWQTEERFEIHIENANGAL